jgi:hypothetical protein
LIIGSDGEESLVRQKLKQLRQELTEVEDEQLS